MIGVEERYQKGKPNVLVGYFLNGYKGSQYLKESDRNEKSTCEVLSTNKIWSGLYFRLSCSLTRGIASDTNTLL